MTMDIYGLLCMIPRVLTIALETTSPSPGLVIEAWDPPLNAKNPKISIKAPRLTSGIEWAIISTSPYNDAIFFISIWSLLCQKEPYE